MMMKKTAVLVCLLLVSSMMVTTAAVSAKKPGTDPPDPGPTPTGTLYVLHPEDGTNWVWSMDPDGTNAAHDHEWSVGYQGWMMSRAQHGGFWWYVGWKAETGYYPDGQPRFHIYAAREDGQNEVQVTTDDDMELNYLCIDPIWGHDDGYVSFSAMVWGTDGSGNDMVEEAGIYTVSLTWDANGDISAVGTVGDPIYSCSVYTSPTGLRWPYARDYMDWSPDGEKMAFMEWDPDVAGLNIMIYDTTSDSLSTLTAGIYPKWSPDGKKIAFGGSGSHLYVINVDGTGITELVTAVSKKTQRGRVETWDWSPDSEFLSYHYKVTNTQTYNLIVNGVYVVSMSGSTDCVTDTWNDGTIVNVGWR